MFNLPILEIKFNTIKEFCAEKRKEGLDLDYKADWPGDLAPIVCGMANVQGGMILIGVKADSNREPEWPPPGVVGTEDSLSQRAVQICYDSIYPPVQPEVRVCFLDNDTKRAIVVIRIAPSRLLHATDKRSKVYVRVADHSRGYELAKLSDLEWLFQQRQESVTLRERAIQRAKDRAERFMKASIEARPSMSMGEVLLPKEFPILTAYCAPEFPFPTISGATPEATPPKLLEVAESVGYKQPGAGLKKGLPRSAIFSPTFQGVFVTNRDQEIEYFELGTLGSLFFRREVLISRTSQQSFYCTDVLHLTEAFLMYVEHFYRELKWRGWLSIKITLQNPLSIGMSCGPVGQRISACQDQDVPLLEGERHTDDLRDNLDKAMQEIFCSLLWAFGIAINEEQANQELRGLRPGRIT